MDIGLPGEPANFKARVEWIVSQIPFGRVMTYGQIAALCGNARAARVVGGVAHYGNPTMPWHRVVNRHGGLASGYPGGRAAHAAHLGLEGVATKDGKISDFNIRLWSPN